MKGYVVNFELRAMDFVSCQTVPSNSLLLPLGNVKKNYFDLDLLIADFVVNKIRGTRERERN